MEPMLQHKIRSMGVADAIEMLERDMHLPRTEALRQIMIVLEQDGAMLPTHVLQEGDWEYTVPDENVCTFSPS